MTYERNLPQITTLVYYQVFSKEYLLLLVKIMTNHTKKICHEDKCHNFEILEILNFKKGHHTLDFCFQWIKRYGPLTCSRPDDQVALAAVS